MWPTDDMQQLKGMQISLANKILGYFWVILKLSSSLSDRTKAWDSTTQNTLHVDIDVRKFPFRIQNNSK